MNETNYQNFLEKISKSSGMEKEEIERKIEAKRAKLSGLISREGAMQIIAAELGISFDNEKLKVSELLPGMRKVNVVGKVVNLFPVRTFNKNGKEGKVANMNIADETGNIRVVLWDVNHIELIEKNEVGENSVVEIANASMRGNEIHLGSFSDFRLSGEKIESVNTAKVVHQANISEFTAPNSVSVRAFVVQAYEPRFFSVCPECKKKVSEDMSCATHGSVAPEKRAVMNIVIDDGTESIRSVLFHDSISKIGLTDLENIESQIIQRQDLLGKEMVFSGDVRTNNYFNTTEFIINDVKQINPDEILAKLQ